jgi:hypothetical protein
MNINTHAASKGLQGQSARIELRLWRLLNFALGTALGLCLAGASGALLAGIASALVFLGPEVFPLVRAIRSGAPG